MLLSILRCTEVLYEINRDTQRCASFEVVKRSLSKANAAQRCPCHKNAHSSKNEHGTPGENAALRRGSAETEKGVIGSMFCAKGFAVQPSPGANPDRTQIFSPQESLSMVTLFGE